MKKTFATLTLAAILTFGMTFANASQDPNTLCVQDPNTNAAQDPNTLCEQDPNTNAAQDPNTFSYILTALKGMLISD